MATPCKDASVAGLWIEAYDSSGQFLGQVVYFDWQRRPLPSVGDRLALDIATADSATCHFEGEICSRHFDVQETPDGEPAVWVRLVARRTSAARPATMQLPRFAFSAN